MSKFGSNIPEQLEFKIDQEDLNYKIDKEIKVILGRLKASDKLFNAANYVFSSGKKIRPRLSAVYFHELGGRGLESILPALVAIELLHNASLIHDDLPALDNDILRRGRNTCHVEYGESTAVLLGDVLVPIAFEQLSGLSYPVEVRTRIMSELARAYTDLCIGQQLDIESISNGSKHDLASIAVLKTGGLFRLALIIPPIALEQPEQVISLSADIGTQLGVIFQICDDYADLYSVDKKGRVESSDKRNIKETFFSNNSKSDTLEFLRSNIEEVHTKFDKISNFNQITFSETKLILNQFLSIIDVVDVNF